MSDDVDYTPKHAAEEPTHPLLSNRSYDILKRTATIVLPALGALYFTLAQIWGLPNADEVVGTIAAVNTFAGVVLSISTRSYNHSDAKYDGSIDVSETEDGKKMFSLNLDSNPYELEKHEAVTFRVLSR